ncbi:MAG TPA: universal stress protein [Polyangiaceae bacterium]
MLSRILVAVDASVREPSVFDAGAQLAEELGAALYVLRVLTVSPEFPAAAAGSVADSLPAHLTRLAVLELSELWKRAPHLQVTTPIVAVGQPWKVILEVAKDFDVDLIVLGSHGYKGWDHVLGTTSGKVVNHADRNVLVVHERAAPESLGQGGLPRGSA